ncbi:metallophosphoesterase [uncultured Roseibium sp.]|uniref:metallophosphoesterase n=1 Tax=uncultured Roseibium sp. TaxID=1936171 RepID=UPI00261179C5|nr:metallophosphoesterase [uncultured Roseibium sp.]
MTTFFTSDTHFTHDRILKLANRPYRSIQEMEKAFIQNWNATVSREDTVWHLGDFGFDEISPGKAAELFHRLNGKKNLILGNHDPSHLPTLPWESTRTSIEISVEGECVFLCHYPWMTWPGARKGVIHLFGHLHGKWLGTDRSTDVGVDAWGYKPVSLPEIKRRLAKLKPNEILKKTGARM